MVGQQGFRLSWLLQASARVVITPSVLPPLRPKLQQRSESSSGLDTLVPGAIMALLLGIATVFRPTRRFVLLPQKQCCCPDPVLPRTITHFGVHRRASPGR